MPNEPDAQDQWDPSQLIADAELVDPGTGSYSTDWLEKADPAELLAAAKAESTAARATVGMAFRYKRLRGRLLRLTAEFDEIRREYDRAIREVDVQLQPLVDALCSLGQWHRDRTGETKFEVPGLLTVRTRKVPSKPRVADPDAVIAALSGSERETYLRPQPDKLEAAYVLRDLATLIEARGGELLPGIEYSTAHVSAEVVPFERAEDWG